MKLSKYNIYEVIDESNYIFNTLNSTYIKISSNDQEKINNGQIDQLENNKTMIESGMLIESEIDELELLKQRYINAVNSKDLLTITIAPTLRCNFRCPYCYEDKNAKKIGVVEEEKIINFIKNQLSKGYKKLDLIWFGGEPLMAFDSIKRISKEIIKFCEEKCIEYDSYLTTNGFLLDTIDSNELLKLKIKQMYITLDGPKEVHDKRRFLINGGETFDKIVSNIEKIKKDVKIIIRMNVDKTNSNYIEDLRNIVTNKLKLPMYLGLVRKYTDSCTEEDIYYSKEDYSKLCDDFDNNQEKDIRLDYKFPRQLPIYCRACKKGTFVIDPDLNVFKCENDIGRVENRIFNISDYNFSNEEEYNSRFSEWNPFDYKKCTDCNMLPICMGGCPFVGINNNFPECEVYKYNFHVLAKKLINRSNN